MAIGQEGDGNPGEEVGRREREPHHDAHLAIVEGEVAADVLDEDGDDRAIADVEGRDEEQQEQDVPDVALAGRSPVVRVHPQNSTGSFRCFA